jgi:hypothetical protein
MTSGGLGALPTLRAIFFLLAKMQRRKGKQGYLGLSALCKCIFFYQIGIIPPKYKRCHQKKSDFKMGSDW